MPLHFKFWLSCKWTVMNRIGQIKFYFLLTVILFIEPIFQDKILCHHCGAIPCPADHVEQKKERLVDLNIVKEMSKGKQELEKKVQEVSYTFPFAGFWGHDVEVKNFISLLWTHDLQVRGSKRFGCHTDLWTVNRCCTRGESEDHTG